MLTYFKQKSINSFSGIVSPRGTFSYLQFFLQHQSGKMAGQGGCLAIIDYLKKQLILKAAA
jgi:hypothetical protein